MNYRYLSSSAWTGRAHRTTGSAFKDADYGQAFWLHEPHRSRGSSRLYIVAGLLAAAALTVFIFTGLTHV